MTDEPAAATPPKAKPNRFAQAFWLTFLVVSLGYAWYSFYVPSNDVDWADSLASAQSRAVASDKPMILFITGEWCVPCRIMKREVWADEQVAQRVNTDFVPVAIYVDGPDAAATADRYGALGTPSTIVTDPEGNVLKSEWGGLSKTEFLGLLDASVGRSLSDG
ncbi:MAG: thioredoxin family protein [Planctomycetota bacterium]